MKNFKRIAAVIIVLAICVALYGCSSGTGNTQSGQPDKVTIATQSLVAPEAIAKAMGWLSEELGVEIDLIYFDSGRDINLAISSGTVDFGIMGSVSASQAIANELPCKVIYIHNVLGDIEALVVRDDLGVTDVHGLKGLKIATTFSTTTHFSLLKYLEANNISPNDIDIIDMNSGEIAAAFIRGDIDGAFTWEPHLTLMMSEGAVIITTAQELADLGYATMDVEIVHSGFADNYPDIVKAYIRCMERAVRLLENDRDAAGDAIASNLGISREDALSQVDKTIWLTVDEQKGSQWFGSSSLANTLHSTAMFLFDQGAIVVEPTIELFQTGVDGQYFD